MKRFSKLVLFVASFITMTGSTWGQTPSTEGRDFWVALTYGTAPEGKIDKQELFLAVSAQEDCKVSVKNPNTNWAGITDYEVKAGTWTTLSGTDNTIPNEQWWPGKEKVDVNGETLDKGLHVTSTKDISLFAAMRYEFSFDASMILPTHVLQKEYIIQDYPPYDHKGKTSWSTYSILAVEAGTTSVQITPVGASSPNQPITLKQGQVYYVVSSDKASLSGTHILADKAVAVFNGDVCTDVPGVISARDLTYEQAMPVDYWGTEFVVTRSLYKDANRVRITAQENDTKITIDGQSVTTINAGKTYEFEMSEGTANITKIYNKITENGLPIPDIFNGEAHYIQTSCPCAVYCYEVSQEYANNYDNNTSLPTEVPQVWDPDADKGKGAYVNLGDPSMVWISPLEQRIKHLTFGVCPTDHITDHNVNIVVLTSDVKNVKLSSKSNDSIILNFKELAGTKYSYARQKICNSSTNDDQVFTLSCPTGFIAHIYGNGLKESYAYSAGSSAVSLGTITVGDQTFQDGTISNTPICANDIYTFDASAGTTVIDRIDWDFGDGITTTVYEASITHQYTSPGWYDATAKLYAHKDCPDTIYPPFDVNFTFRVVRADTVIDSLRHECISIEEYKAYPVESEAKIQNGEIKEDPQVHCYDDIHRYFVVYGKETEETKDTIVDQDSAVGYNGKTYYESTDVEDTLTNDYNCPHYVRYHVKVKTCLAMTMASSSENCPGKNIIVDYTKTKGDIKNPVRFVVTGLVDTTFNMSNENTQPGKTAQLYLPTTSIKKPGYYRGTLTIQDANDCDAKTFPIDFAVKYPEDIFDFKFTNVLAVRKDAGYNFRNYQWYINGKPVGGDVSVLYLGEGVALKNNDLVYVKLTDQSGMVLESCPKTIQYKEGQLQPNKAPARKVMQNQRIYILRDEQVYDIFGQKVK